MDDISVREQALLTLMHEDIQRCGSIFYAYPAPPAEETPVPVGYKPFYISHYGRHGSRYQTSESRYGGMVDLLREQQSAGNLTPDGEELLRRMETLRQETLGHGGQLSTIGVRQHREIASRMARRVDGVFCEGAVVDARSSTVKRCQDSMDAFLESLSSTCPGLKVSRRSDEQTMAVLVPHNPQLDSLNAEDAFWKLSWWNEYRREVMHPERLLATYFKDAGAIRDGIEFMQALYYLVVGQQDIPSQVDLSDALSPEELIGCWKAISARMYYPNCNCPVTGGIGPQSARPLLQDFLDRARAAVAGQEKAAGKGDGAAVKGAELAGKGAEAPVCGQGAEDVESQVTEAAVKAAGPPVCEQGPEAATLRFGHDTNLIRLLSLMGVEGCDRVEDDFRHYWSAWKDWAVSPMAANLQMVLYRGPRGKVLAKLLLNEREVGIPALGKGPYYRWPSVEAYWEQILSDSCDGSD